MPVYCVELGSHQSRNLCRMTYSIIFPGQTILDAFEFVETQFSELLAQGGIQRVLTIKHALINWATGEITVVPELEGESVVRSNGNGSRSNREQ